MRLQKLQKNKGFIIQDQVSQFNKGVLEILNDT